MKRIIKKYLKLIGPGFITGASDDDPSGIATYSQTGAVFGYTQLWTALFTFPFMSVVQEMCGRIGMVTGKGLSGVILHNYAKPILYLMVFLLFIANIINIGADLGAMASSTKLLVNINFDILLIFFMSLTLLLEVFVPYQAYAKILKYLTLSLFAYIATFFIVQQDWTKILVATITPSISLNKAYLLNIVAILGTTISPYLFFWQASQEVEEEVAEHKLRTMGRGIPHVMKHNITEMRMDTIIGMFFSNIIMFFVIATTASTLHTSGIGSVATATQAAQALKPLAGDYAYLLFALGIIGTGLLAIPILAGSASYALSEAFGWKEGLYRKFTKAHGFYGVVTIATVIGLFINFLKIEPFTLLYYTAVLNGICAPPLLIMIMIIANNKNIMGAYVNKKASNILGWTITGIMSICAVALLSQLLF